MIVVDTHVLIWAVEHDRRLGVEARREIDRASASGGVHVSAITPWEVALLVSKGRLALGRELGAWMAQALALPGVLLSPITPAIALDSVALPGGLHADPADRLIVATARSLGCPLLTADRALLDYGAAGHVATLTARA